MSCLAEPSPKIFHFGGRFSDNTSRPGDFLTYFISKKCSFRKVSERVQIFGRHAAGGESYQRPAATAAACSSLLTQPGDSAVAACCSLVSLTYPNPSSYLTLQQTTAVAVGKYRASGVPLSSATRRCPSLRISQQTEHQWKVSGGRESKHSGKLMSQHLGTCVVWSSHEVAHE